MNKVREKRDEYNIGLFMKNAINKFIEYNTKFDLSYKGIGDIELKNKL